MNIAIASGKGGTGKTTIATNLAVFLAQQQIEVVYLDCDVEEPNGHLFLKPKITETHEATVPVPVINDELCTGCGTCIKICQFNALVRLGKSIMVFPELCHSCGGCTLVCPQKAISEQLRETGKVQKGISGEITFVQGRLHIGEAISPPVIDQVLQLLKKDAINIIDAPPGTSCPVIASIRSADFVVLVTEPTPFGLYDLSLALKLVRALKIPFGIVINRAESSNKEAIDFCHQHEAPLLALLPDNHTAAQCYSKGNLILHDIPEMAKFFDSLWVSIKRYITQ